MAEEKITSFTKLKVWQKAHLLVIAVYKITESFPKNEQFGLTSQLRRAVSSVTCNLAEGFNRFTAADKAHFYQMAIGSCAEVQNLLLISRDLNYLKLGDFQKFAIDTVEVHRMLNGLIKAVKAGA